jgi:hypothetical protein
MKSEIRNQKSKLRIIEGLFNILSSKVFLLWIIGGWIVYYVSSAIWTKEVFASFVMGIEKSPFIQIPFILFLISGYLNLLRASRDIFKKGKIQFLAWVFLPAGILLFFTGFFLSIYMRQSGQRIMGEGDILKPPWSSESYSITKIEPGLKESSLDIDADKGIFAYEPKLTILDKNSNSFEVGAFPPTKIDNTYYHILNFGIAPGIRLLQGSNTRDEGYMPLRILAPGSSDYFEIPPHPYRFLISMEPERTFQKGNLYVSQFNLKKPIYRVRVFKGEKIIAQGDSKQGIHFDDFTLYFFEPTFWILLEAVRDPGVPVILSGILLVIIGVPMSLMRFLSKLFKKEYVVNR